MILISAGFDGHRDDPLGGFAVTEEGFAEIAKHWVGLASDLCEGRIAAVLEGGYDLGGLGRSVRSLLQAWQ